MSLRSHVRRPFVLVAALGLASALGAAACANRVDSVEEAPVQTERQAWQGPVSVVVEAALTHGELTVEQHAAIAAVGDRANVTREHKREMKEKLRASVSDIVRDGTVDSQKFDVVMDDAMRAIEERMVFTAEALGEVHQLLDADQRAAVAEALREHIADRYEQKAKRAEKRGKLEKLAAHLMLTGVQLDELKKVKKELIGERKGLRPSRGELEALVDAFEGDDFRAAVDAFHDGKLKVMRERVTRVAEHTDTALSLLSDEQRDVLAELIELGPEQAGLEH